MTFNTPKPILDIVAILEKKGYSKDYHYVPAEKIPIYLCIDSTKYYYEFDRDIIELWPENGELKALVEFQNETWKGDKKISSRTETDIETINESIPTEDDKDYELPEYCSYNTTLLKKHFGINE